MRYTGSRPIKYRMPGCGCSCRSASATALLHTLGPAEQAQSILTEALAIADTLGDLHAQLRVLSVLSSVNVYRGEYARGAVEVERAAEIAHRIGDLPSVVVAERRMGTTLLTIGKLSEAQRWLERAIRSPLYLEEGQLPVWRHSGDRAMARAMLARALWLQGFPDNSRSWKRMPRKTRSRLRWPSRRPARCAAL